MMRTRLALLGALLAFGLAARGEEPEARLELKGADLRAVVAEIATRAGVTILVEPSPVVTVTLSVAREPWREALDAVAARAGWQVETLPGGTLVLVDPPRVTMQFKNAHQVTLVLLLAAYAGKNNIVVPRLGRPVAVDIRETPWRAALEDICRGAGWTPYRSGYLVVVTDRKPPPGARPLEREIDAWPEGEPQGPNVPIDLSLTNAPPAEAARAIAAKARREIRVENEADLAHEQPLTLILRHAPWRDALSFVAHASGCKIVERGGTLVFVSPPKNTIQSTNAPAGLFFEMLERQARAGVSIPRDLGGAVTIDLHEIPYDAALKEVALASGYRFASNARGEPGLEATTLVPELAPVASGARTTWFDHTPVELAKYGLRVTAILVDPDKRRSAAIVVCDDPTGRGALHATGDGLRDRSGRPIEGLSVELIEEGSVVLRWKKTRFYVELDAP